MTKIKMLTLNKVKEKLESSRRLGTEDLQNKYPDVYEQIAQYFKKESKALILGFNFEEDHEIKTRCHCTTCGASWTETFSSHYDRMYKVISCPSCGLKKATSDSLIGRKRFCFVKEFNEIDGYAVITTVDTDGKFPYSDEQYENVDYSTIDLDINVFYSFDSLFSFRFGLVPNGSLMTSEECTAHFYSYETRKYDKLVHPTSSDYQSSCSYVSSVQELCPNKKSKNLISYMKANMGIECSSKELLEKLVSINSDMIAAKKQKEKSKDGLEKKYPDIKNISINEILRMDKKNIMGDFIFFSKSGVKGSEYTYDIYCTCGEKFQYKTTTLLEYYHYDIPEDLICPKCGKHMKAKYQISDSKKGKASQWAHMLELLPDKNLLYRVFDVQTMFDMDSGSFSKSMREERFVFSQKSVTCYSCNDSGKWVKIPLTKSIFWDSWFEEDHEFLQEEECLKAIIADSVFNRLGVFEAWGMTDGFCKSFKPFDFLSKESYIYQVIKMPFLEKMIKTGLIGLANEMIMAQACRDAVYDLKASSIIDMLGINRPLLKIAKEYNLGIYAINLLRTAFKSDPSFDKVAYERLKNVFAMAYHKETEEAIESHFETGFQRVTLISEQHGIKIKDIATYLDSCYGNQCIMPSEALQIWKDYLDMAKDMNYNLSATSKKMPGSLKKEHDRASFAYEAVQNEVQKEKFRKISEENQKYKYDSDERFEVIVPLTPEEVVAEGDAQHHCVSLYVNKIREGTSVIVFIREKANLTESYFTMEICDGKIMQIRGLCNCLPSDGELIRFIRNYAVEKDLSIRPVSYILR